MSNQIKAIETLYAGSPQEYARIHYAARAHLQGRSCDTCGGGLNIQAALRPGTPAERLYVDPTTGCLYSVLVGDYSPLCVGCHRKTDLVEGRPACTSGHAYTPENTSLKRDGSRRCLACHREQERKRIADPAKRAAKLAASRHRNPLTTEQRARKTELQRARRVAARSARFEFGECG